jgi:hypothetical protein
MASSIRRTSRFPVSPEAVLQALTNPALLEAQQRQQGAARARVTERLREGPRLVQEVEADEYARTLTGIDKTRTERAVTTYEWDLSERRCTWRYAGPHGDRVRVGGSLRVLPAAGGAELHSEITVSVRVPLIGRVIERRIVSQIEAGMPEYEGLIRKFAPAQ